MTHDEFMNEVQRMFGVVRADAYKAGFTDGINFVSNTSNGLIEAFKKAADNALSQVWYQYGKGKEYKAAIECIDAVLLDLIKASHLNTQESNINDFWEDEEI